MNPQIFQAIVSGGQGITITLSASDLRDVVASMVDQERQRIDKAIERHREEACLTRKQTCEKLGVSVNTLINWERDGYLRSVRVGRKCLYRPSDLDEILQRRQRI